MEQSYVSVIEEIKKKIRNSQHKVILNANKEMLIFYWNIGKVIDENSIWGSKFLRNLSKEIRNEFSPAKGFSISNLKIWLNFIENIVMLKLASR